MKRKYVGWTSVEKKSCSRFIGLCSREWHSSLKKREVQVNTKSVHLVIPTTHLRYTFEYTKFPALVHRWLYLLRKKSSSPQLYKSLFVRFYTVFLSSIVRRAVSIVWRARDPDAWWMAGSSSGKGSDQYRASFTPMSSLQMNGQGLVKTEEILAPIPR